MGTVWVLVLVGGLGLVAVLFEVAAMRSPGAGLTPLGILDAVVEVAFQGLIQRLFGP